MFLFSVLEKKMKMPDPASALPGRETPVETAATHFVNGKPLAGPLADTEEEVLFALGCFWGAERVFWQTPGVVVTAVGYAGGYTPNPTYQEVCSGMTGHTEVVRVVYDTTSIAFADLLRIFWESHDPTQGMRQGNDTGTQYRSAIYCASEAQLMAAEASRAAYQAALAASGRQSAITTEIKPMPAFYYAEDYHQQYLAKNPNGYCGLGGTGVSCPALPVSAD